jgi:hypothetical protein
MVYGIADMNFGLSDMNRCHLYAPLAPVNVAGGKRQPVKMITDNSVETVVFRNTEMNNDSLDAV